MKIKKFRLKLDGGGCDFCLPNGDNFACVDILRNFFPHIKIDRKRIDMAVYSHAVKGSKRFRIAQDWHTAHREGYYTLGDYNGNGGSYIRGSSYGYCTYRIREVVGSLWDTMEDAIKSILVRFRDSIRTEGRGMEMYVWVTVK